MKNYNVTKTMKTEVIHQLVEAYIIAKLQGPNQSLSNVHRIVWLDYTRYFESKTGIEEKFWENLALLQVVRNAQDIFMASKQVSQEVGELFSRFRGRLKCLQYITYGPYGRQLGVYLRPSKSTPNIEGYEPFAKQKVFAERALNDVAETLSKALLLQTELWTVLTPLRTYNRILEVLPEAAALLEKPEPKNQVIPVSLVESVRQKLS